MIFDDMRLAMSNIHPKIEKLAKETQSQKIITIKQNIM